jgi:hypothetical protein
MVTADLPLEESGLMGACDDLPGDSLESGIIA